MEWGEEPRAHVGRSTAFGLAPLLCHSTGSVLPLGCRTGRASSGTGQVAAGAEWGQPESLRTALPGTIPRAMQGGCGRRDPGRGQSHLPASHQDWARLPCAPARVGAAVLAAARPGLAPVPPWSSHAALDESHPCFLPQSFVCKMDTNTSQGCCET